MTTEQLLVAIVRARRIRPSERVVLLSLAVRANRDGMVALCKRDLLAAAECSNMTVVGALQRLRARGVLTWSDSRHGRPRVFEIHPEQLA